VQFIGRLSDIINVGGNKVHPLVVERVIRELANVADARVFGVPSSIAGQLVACQVVPRAGADVDALRHEIGQHCVQRLDRYQCPRVIEIVPRLELTAAGKIARHGG
jgi:acyl-CoA synthetase (AMP-forming)/AMP-acid ligase II